MAYIYKITNDINGKIYVGKTYQSIDKRFKEHIKDSKRQRCKNRPLYRAINKYGVEHFHIDKIEETNFPEEREQYWIQYFNSYHKGYNATLGGDGKPYVDYNLVVNTYKQVNTIKETSKITNISEDTVSKIIKLYGFQFDDKGRIKIAKCDKNGNIICIYQSIHDAAKDLSKPNSNIKTIVSYISRSCKKGNIAYGYKWIFV